MKVICVLVSCPDESSAEISRKAIGELLAELVAKLGAVVEFGPREVETE